MRLPEEAMSEGSPLRATQRRLQRWITAPEGVQHALDADGDPHGRGLAAVVRGDGALSPVRRLTVYANAYFHRIHDALAEDFAALQAALGRDLFHDLVTLYLVAHPSRRPSLRDVGERLPGFLSGEAAAAPLRERVPWAGDLARLEWALVDAFDAPDAAALSRDALAGLAPEAWEGLRLRFQPALCVLDLAWRVRALREAWDRGDDVVAAAAERDPETLVVWRADERVRYRRAEPDEARLLALARRGEPFGALCLAVAARRGESDAPAVAAGLLARWQADQLLIGMRPG
jgi:hypothetical protein